MRNHTTTRDTGPFRPETVRETPCTVFLIEDDADDRNLAQRVIESCDFVKDVITFKNGQELTEYMKDKGFMDRTVMLYTPILLMIDLEMPVKDGLEVLRELKSDKFLEAIPMYLFTGTQSRDKMFEALRCGASGVFKKPLDRDVLSTFFQEGWIWPPKELWN